MQITTSIEKIGPEAANNMLLFNHATQRNVSQSHVANIAAQMKKGLWRTNGEPIIIDENGDIADGQHRLRGVVLSGVTIEFLIVRGVSSDVFTTIDRGMTRSAGNSFTISGIMNGTAAAACVAGVMNYRRALAVVTREKGGGYIYGGSLSTNIKYSPQEFINEYRKHEDKYIEALTNGRKVRHVMSLSTATTVAALALIDGKKGSGWVSEFWDSVSTGERLTREHPAYHLRERHIDNKASRHKFSSNYSILLSAKAWNAFAEEKPTKLLRLMDERAFPIV